MAFDTSLSLSSPPAVVATIGIIKTLSAIPSIPLESFTTLNLSPVSNNGSFKLFENSEKQSCVVTTTFLDPESEKYINDGRLSKAFSFGGNASQLFN